MTVNLSKKLKSDLELLKQLSDSAKISLGEIEKNRNANDTQHQVLMLSLVRAIKYFDAYLMLVENGYGEPAATLVRSIYETNLWMRWSLVKKENADRYFNASKGETLRMAKKLNDRGLARFVNAQNREEMTNLVIGEIKAFEMPRWEELARESGLSDLHALVYPILSGMSHGNLLSMGERILEDKKVSPLADEKNIELFIPIANNVFRDCHLLCEEWIVNGKLHPIPNVRKLLIHK